MLDLKIVKRGALHAALTLLYILCVATIMRNASRIFGDMVEWTGPVVILSLLVVSAATVGSLIFAKPVMLYIDGKKNEAVTLLFSTIGILAIITTLFLFIMALTNGASNSYGGV
jgi:hypothetical protein